MPYQLLYMYYFWIILLKHIYQFTSIYDVNEIITSYLVPITSGQINSPIKFSMAKWFWLSFIWNNCLCQKLGNNKGNVRATSCRPLLLWSQRLDSPRFPLAMSIIVTFWHKCRPTNSFLCCLSYANCGIHTVGCTKQLEMIKSQFCLHAI